MLDRELVKLGKLKPKYDPRLLRLESYLPARLPQPKPSIMWSNAVEKWGMLLNDHIGDCTIAGWGHLRLLRSSLRKSPIVMSDDDAQNDYIAVTGEEGNPYDPKTGQNDNGCVETDVLNYFRKNGQIGAFVSVRPLSTNTVKFVIDAFEGIYVGAAMPLNCSSQDVWNTTGDLTGEAAPGSWGGHCLVAIDYDAEGVTFVTWGMTQKATWAWWNAYIDEAYAILSPDLVTNKSNAPSGFNLAQLQSDLQAVTA